MPTLYAATADIPGGSGPDGFQEMRGEPKVVKATRAARDPQTALCLWEVSEQLTGVRLSVAEGSAASLSKS